ncbi:unnamed protein product [Absidia cylindrospora]
MTNAYLMLLTKYLPDLKTLQLDAARDVTTAGISMVAQHCPLLESLCIKHGEVSDGGLKALSQHCPRLSSLVLNHCPAFGVGSFKCLQECPLLRTLVLDIGAFADDYGFRHGVTELVVDLLELSSLTKLVLMRCPKGFGKALFDEVKSKERKHRTSTVDLPGTTTTATTAPAAAAAAATAACWPDLNEFSMEGCIGVGELRMLNFLKAHPLLTKVTLDKNQFTDDFLELIPTMVPGLERLSLGYCEWITSDGLRRLVLDCPTLSYVNVEGGRVDFDDFPEVSQSRSTNRQETHHLSNAEFNSDHEDYDSEFLTYLDHKDIVKVRKGGMNPDPRPVPQYYVPPPPIPQQQQQQQQQPANHIPLYLNCGYPTHNIPAAFRELQTFQPPSTQPPPSTQRQPSSAELSSLLEAYNAARSNGMLSGGSGQGGSGEPKPYGFG